MKEQIAEFIREKAYRPLTLDELKTAMGVTERNTAHFIKTLEQMESTGEVVQTRLERYGAPEKMNLAVGRIQGHPKGFGFLISDQAGVDDTFIGREGLGGALHNDRVVVRLSPPTRPGGRPEGEVIRVLHRANQRIVGTFEVAKNAGYVTPDDRRLHEDILIPKGATNGAKSGEKVVVQVVEFSGSRRNAEGRIVERLGMKGQVGVDIVSIIRKHNLPEAFPPRVLADSEAVPETVPPEVATESGRRDLREWTIVTIDGADAKDLDDAVNVERIGEGRWRLGVHIADVAYYVAEGSALDQEAYKRGTSVYLADRVVPMLPPRLSDGICSLNPKVDRLTLSCVMEINAEGQVLSYEIFPSVIKTVGRMTYTRVNEILAGDAQAHAEYASLVPMFSEMETLMGVLRGKRTRRGAIDFDLPEAKVTLSDAGWPIEIRRVERGISERMIEEFMLAANETVAQHCSKLKVPFMYRVHGEPAGERMAGLKEFLGLFDYQLKVSRETSVNPKILQAVTLWAKGRTEENLINSVVLRTMRQAIYSEQNLGHFGLASDFYAHFTSPIRRYPDLIVHRILRAIISNGLTPKVKSKWERTLPDVARHASDRERVAVEAERETIDLKKAEFMSDKVGQTFDGFISGVSQFGFFVQLFNTVEGLVHISALTDDYYHFHEDQYSLLGERTRRRFRLGDKVSVRLLRVDIENRQIDFGLESLELTSANFAPTVVSQTRSRALRHEAVAGRESDAISTTEVTPSKSSRNKRRRTKAKQQRAEALLATTATTAATEPQVDAAKVHVQSPSAREQQTVKSVDRSAQKPAAKSTENTVEKAVEKAMEMPIERSELKKFEQQAENQRPGRMQSRPIQRQESGSAPMRPIRVSSGVDMWGLPVPSGRPQRWIEDDPGVVNPFSLTAPRGRDRGGSGSSGDRKRPNEAAAPAKTDKPRRQPRARGVEPASAGPKES